MTWVRLDDQFGEHPKIVGLSDRAFRAHVTGLLYCGRYLTDGRLPRGVLPPARALAELVAAGLWTANGTGEYSIHDYLEYQPTREQVEREIAQKRAAGRAGGKAAAKARAKAAAKAPPQAKSKPIPIPIPIPIPHTPKPRAERERNPAFDALAEATGSDPTKLTRSAARTIGVALAEIAEAETSEVAGPCPPDLLAKNIREVARRFRQRHPEWDLTPMSLAKWWPTCQEIVPESTRTRTVGAVDVKTWEGDPPWVREGLTWQQWQEREKDETDVGSDPGTSGGAPESGPAPPQEPPAEETG